MARQYECCVTTLYHLQVNGCGLRCTVFSLFLENAEFKKSGKLKGLKSSSCLSLCLSTKSLPSLRSATDKQTDRQTNRQSDYYNPLMHAR